jgi:tetratricopeptide (TPR) repeat protein
LYFHRRQFAKAAEAYEKSTELNPSSPYGWGYLGDAYRWTPGQEGQAAEAYRKAISLLEAAVKINEADARKRASLAVFLSDIHDNQRALDQIKIALASNAVDGFILSRAVIVYEQCGKRKEALDLIERVAEANALKDLETSPALDDLRGDLRYQDIVRSWQKGVRARAKQDG